MHTTIGRLSACFQCYGIQESCTKHIFRRRYYIDSKRNREGGNCHSFKANHGYGYVVSGICRFALASNIVWLARTLARKFAIDGVQNARIHPQSSVNLSSKRTTPLPRFFISTGCRQWGLAKTLAFLVSRTTGRPLSSVHGTTQSSP